jgi:6-phosphofructokinase 1
VKDRGSAVVVLAEGAGQELLKGSGATDESGNARFADIGVHLRGKITRYFADQGSPLTLKYVEPSYAIRSVRPDPHDAVYCLRLAQSAVHAGMAGRTDMVVGRRHNRFIHVPISLVISERYQVAPDGDLWMSVLEQTAEPVEMR